VSSHIGEHLGEHKTMYLCFQYSSLSTPNVAETKVLMTYKLDRIDMFIRGTGHVYFAAAKLLGISLCSTTPYQYMECRVLLTVSCTIVSLQLYWSIKLISQYI